ncbi:MAG: transcription-repair coupling factor [Anaerolineales bacterium]|nr:transcription-repair coupling factor [Anaerolineales bacterium]
MNNDLVELIRKTPEYQDLLRQLQSGERLAAIGLPRPARLPVLAALHYDLERSLLLLTNRADQALCMLDELSFWLPDAPRYLFPEPNPLFYEEAAWGVTTRRDRLQTLTALSAFHLPFAKSPETPPVLVASARAVMTRTLPRRDFLKSSRAIKIAQKIQPETLLYEWAGIGYQAADTVLESGQFAHRGGLLDIWPPAEKSPVRLDFFGDEIEIIRRFDPATQRTLEKLDQILVTPAREVLPGHARELVESLPPESFSEFYLPVVHRVPASLLDYLPQGSLVLVDDLGLVEGMVAEVEEQAVAFRMESNREGTLPGDFPVPYLSWSELSDSLQAHPVLELGYSPGEAGTVGNVLSALFKPGMRFGGRLKEFIDHLGGLIEGGQVVTVVSRQCARLQELWQERLLAVDHTRLASAGMPEVVFLEASLTEGWILGDVHLITDSEIFGWERPQPRRRPRPIAETPESIYADFRSGDWVVHVDYGIGRYVGLIQRSLDGLEREYLCIEYKNSDQLFVPIHQADRLTKYIGPDAAAPSLGSLGNQEWPETKRRVKEAVQQVAGELLDLYARRQVAEGHAFGQDSPWQSELEASFPYVETEDQLRVLQEVKQDMESRRPMDRLLCGDVGYGKTEVALRAAFKAVMDGKQVAILVPTTVLAQQHYETFKQRLAAYPVKVEMLSRFRTQREQSSILLDLALGLLDIVIGTHRLVQSDVEFKDLGLVIIDEEQRFGVTHKEHLKKLRTEVDVLTMTATPIPRTLYMALTGVRDISTLDTPPEERLPIVTYIGPYSPRLVRQAILRELERGGQVFFLHNRVQTIDAMMAHLNRLVPEARVEIAHGQMPENALSRVMHRFTEGKVDVLLCTSIIESGLDIPNANTLIVDRGDTFGLAQLYQLRGRVGRGAVRAYAYFFRHRRKPPTNEGQERLEVIAENTQLGAGYSIAMRDLEMRGAGELLGTRQSGYIASVGFHLYTRLLAGAVRMMRRQRGLPEPKEAELLAAGVGVPVNVDLPLPSGIPAEYIPDQNLRLRLYRRLADTMDQVDLDMLAAEFEDRFGPLPEALQTLFYQMHVKLLAEKAGLVSVSMEGGQIILRYPASVEGGHSTRLRDIGAEIRGGKQAYWCSFGKDPDWQRKLLATLIKIVKLRN